MYEEATYEAILSRMLARIPEDFDKREGSIIYDALAPAAVELAMIYMELDAVLNQLFADTASREYLIRRAAERGLSPKPASHAVLKGEFNMDIPIGSRFSLETLNYVAVERISEGVFQMQCETAGAVGNSLFGTLIPIEYIKGLTRAELTELLVPGEDEEETEHFRKKYFDSLVSQAFGGNIADYREKVTAIQGVGGVKVYPAWNGGGTVKLVIVGADYGVPSEELVELVKQQMDPEPSGGGYGLAPIGHQVTVEAADAKKISVKTHITYRTDFDFDKCSEEIYDALDGYFKELNEAWQNEEAVVVRVSRIESRLLDVAGILDVYDTSINGASGNCELPGNAIAVRGDFDGNG